MDFLYNTDSERKILGSAWCGPDQLPHGESVLIATFKKEEDSDGQDVELYCLAMPADFYTIKALEGVNSLGEAKKAYSLGTGSSMLKWAKETCRHIADGMIGLEEF